jgi:putative oxidoreductase
MDVGLLVLRVGLGVMLMCHGWPKLIGGPSELAKFGRAMEMFGVTQGFVFWGFMAAFAEYVGGALIVLGYAFRPMCVLVLITMGVATLKHANAGADFLKVTSRPLELAIVMLGLTILGPGRLNTLDLVRWARARQKAQTAE